MQLQAMIRLLGEDTDVWADDTWLIDSTPVECSRSVPTTKRSRLAGWAGHGYCASHSRFYWGLRLHLVCTPAGLPTVRMLQRRLALTARHLDNHHAGQPVIRSLTASDH